MENEKNPEPKEDGTAPETPFTGVDPVELTRQLEQLESEVSKETAQDDTSKTAVEEVPPKAKKVPLKSEGGPSKPIIGEDVPPKEESRVETAEIDETLETLPSLPHISQLSHADSMTIEPTNVIMQSRVSRFQYEKSKLVRFIDELFRGLDHKTFVKNFINNNDVVVFAKSYCPWCKKAHSLLAKNQIEHVLVYIDLLEEHENKVQTALEEISDMKTVPVTFVCQKKIGGFNDLYRAFQTGMLNSYLSNEFDPYEYDVIIIGGGSGGLAAALEAAKYENIKIAVCDYVEPTPLGTTWGLGGTCANVGCVPKKIMHYAALMAEDLIDAANLGLININSISHEWSVLINGIQDHIKSLNWNYRKKLKAANIDYFKSRAKFISTHSIILKTNDPEKEKIVTSKCFIIAVGCRPTYPNIEGAKEYCITSDDFFSLKEFPGKTLIIGASYIALECAGILCYLGSCVTVMMRSISLRGFDREMAERIEEHLEIVGVRFVRNCIPIRIIKNERNLYTVEGKYDNGELFECDFDTVMFATGRTPNTSHLGLCKINVKVDAKSRKIIVDHKDQTSQKNIFAIGDVAKDRPQLTPVAIKAGKLLVNRLFGGASTLVKYKYIPTTVFTPLEYGCVGETEESAKKLFGNKVVIWQSIFESVETLMSNRNGGDCFLKLICVRMTTPEGRTRDRIIGFHILAYKAGEITQGFAMALIKGVYKDNVSNMPISNITIQYFRSLVQKPIN